MAKHPRIIEKGVDVSVQRYLLALSYQRLNTLWISHVDLYILDLVCIFLSDILGNLSACFVLGEQISADDASSLIQQYFSSGTAYVSSAACHEDRFALEARARDE